MGSGSSVAGQDNREQAADSVSRSGLGQSRLSYDRKQDVSTRNLNIEQFTPSPEEGAEKRTFHFNPSREPDALSNARSLLSECPVLTDEQESKIKACLASLEKLMEHLQLRFDAGNILNHATLVHREGADETQLMDRVGDGLFVVDKGTVELLSPSDGQVHVMQLSAGDYCGEYSTIFNVPFRTKVQFKDSVDLLHMPADVVRLNMHYTGQLDREAMLNLSVVQSNLLSGSLFGADLSKRIVANCLKASLFSGLGEQALDYLASSASPLLFAGGEVVYNEGEMATYIFLVLKGTVHLMKGGELHRVHKVNLSSEGVSVAANEFFEGTILFHGAVAGGPLLLASVGREQILDMLNKFPDRAAAIKKILQRR